MLPNVDVLSCSNLYFGETLVCFHCLCPKWALEALTYDIDNVETHRCMPNFDNGILEK